MQQEAAVLLNASSAQQAHTANPTVSLNPQGPVILVTTVQAVKTHQHPTSMPVARDISVTSEVITRLVVLLVTTSHTGDKETAISVPQALTVKLLVSHGSHI